MSVKGRLSLKMVPIYGSVSLKRDLLKRTTWNGVRLRKVFVSERCAPRKVSGKGVFTSFT